MKRIVSALVLASGLLSAAAADLEWKTDFDKALAQAKADKKAVLINFTGSDWCGFCKRLESEVFSSKEFADFAKENLVLVKADFPRATPISEEQKEANENLKNKFATDFRGYPTVVLVGSDGKKVGQIVGYGPGTGAPKYIEQLRDELD